MNYFLAVDGGGTSTKIALADEAGKILYQVETGPASLTATSVGAASFNLKEAIRQVTEKLTPPWQVSKMVMGLAGLDTAEEEKLAYQVFGEVVKQFPITNFVLINNVKIALIAGTNNFNALAIIASTGSNCYGHNYEGREHWVGGMDFLLTDQGSGYAIGREVLRSAVKSFDLRGEKTVLENKVLEHFKISSMKQLKNVVYNPLLSKPEVADLALLAFAGLETGDRVSQKILDHAIEELFLMAETVIGQLNLLTKNADCVLVGKVVTNPYIRQNLEKKLKTLGSELNIIVSEGNSVAGALKLAMEH